jgi:tetratricopeptide (TPR) repeat protein
MSARLPRTLVLLANLTLATLAVASEAAAQPEKPAAGASDEASRRFRAGVGFYKDRDFAAALVEFKRAYELDPNYRVLFNLGQTSQELNDYASALSAFRRYLDEGGKEIDKARRAKVESSIAALEKKVGTITIETNVAGAEVSVDDVRIGTTPLDKPVLVNAGRHKFAAVLSGHHPAVRQEEVAGLDQSTVKLELAPLETAEAAKPLPVKQEPAPPPPTTKVVTTDEGTSAAPWVMLAFTGAGAVATGVLGGLALSARSDLDGALETFPGDPAAVDDAQSKATTFAVATDIAGGVTAACAITTLVLFAVSGGSKDEAPKTTGTSRGIRITPGIGTLRGVF